MQTIVINSQKGGSGKTTLCAHLSVQAVRAGDGEVFLIDTDPQGTLTTWHEKREADEPRRVELPFQGIADGLDRLRERKVKFCFIDTAPSRTDETAVLSAIPAARIKVLYNPIISSVRQPGGCPSPAFETSF